MRLLLFALSALALIAMLTAPRLAVATEPAVGPPGGEASPGSVALPDEIVPTEGGAPVGEGAPPAEGEAAPALDGPRFGPAPDKGIQPTVSKLPKYWQCQDDLKHRLVVTTLDTKTPTIMLERGGNKVLATQQRSASGTKHMAPGGILFWDRGHEATLQWGSPNAASCTPLGG